MENTNGYYGLNDELATNLIIDFAKDLLSQVDVRGSVKRLKEKYSDTVTEEQWGALIGDIDDIPDFRNEETISEMFDIPEIRQLALEQIKSSNRVTLEKPSEELEEFADKI